MQKKIQKFRDYNIYPNILHVDANAGADARGIQ